MFDNLLYIFSKENEIINNYITDTESIREVKKLKQELIKKNAEIKLLQRRYNKLLNNCIQIELNKKVRSYTLVLYLELSGQNVNRNGLLLRVADFGCLILIKTRMSHAIKVRLLTGLDSTNLHSGLVLTLGTI